MGFSRAGIKAVILDKKNYIDSVTATNRIFLGIRKEGSLIIKTKDDIKDYRERPLQNYMNANAQFTTLQSSIAQLQILTQIFAPDGTIDALIIGEKNSSSTYDGVYKFTSAYNSCGIGLDFEFLRSNLENSCSYTLETDLEIDDAKTLITQANTLGSQSLPIISGGDGDSFANYGTPYLISFQHPTSTEVFAKNEIIERKLSLKTVGSKNAYNQTIIDYILINLELTALNSTASKLDAILQTSPDAGIQIQNKNKVAGSVVTETFTLGQGVLNRTDEFTLGDAKRSVKMVFQGKVPIWDMTFGSNTVTINQ